MFVLCPHCQFLVAVDPVTGLPPVHCPRCDGIVVAPIDASDAVAESPAVESQAEAPAEAEVVPEPGIAVAKADDRASEDSAVPAVPAATDTVGTPPPETEAAAAPANAAPPPAKSAPSFARTAEAAMRGASLAVAWQQMAAIAALALLLLVQIILADRDQLAADARWRPALEAFCAGLRCDLAAWREPSAITLLDRNVVPDPSHPGVLHVTASFRNDARWAQPWPRLVLTLSDVDGRVAGARAFEPREYLGHAVTKNGIASGQSAKIAMDVVEPAPRIVAFTFDFR
ncbi:MAG: DUF3426 domain-containing protein [Luteimonas sp.]